MTTWDVEGEGVNSSTKQCSNKFCSEFWNFSEMNPKWQQNLAGLADMCTVGQSHTFS